MLNTEIFRRQPPNLGEDAIYKVILLTYQNTFLHESYFIFFIEKAVD